MNGQVRSMDFFQLIAAAILWGMSFLFIKVAVGSLPPSTIVGIRLFFSAVFLLCFLYASGKRLPRLGYLWLPFLVLGVTNCTIPYFLITWGEIYVDSGLAAILGATMPLFTMLFSCFVFRSERMTIGKLIGIGVGLIGVVMLVGIDAMQGFGVHFSPQLAIILAYLIYGFAATYGSLLQEADPLVVSTGQLIMGFFTVLPFMMMEKPWNYEPGVMVCLAMLGLAVFSTAIPYVIYFRLLSAIGPTNTSLVTYLMPIVGVVAGVLFLSEHVAVSSILALFLILGGVAGVSGIGKSKIFDHIFGSKKNHEADIRLKG